MNPPRNRDYPASQRLLDHPARHPEVAVPLISCDKQHGVYRPWMASYDQLIAEPTRKLVRAQELIDEIGKRFAAFRNRKRQSSHAGYKNLLHESFPFLIGDTVHNLASALDIAVYAIADKPMCNPRKLAFPFARSRDAFPGQMSNSQIIAKAVGQAVVDAITRLEPFPEGNAQLWAISALNNTDKHRIPVVTTESQRMTADTYALLTGASICGTGLIQISDDGSDPSFVMGRDAFLAFGGGGPAWTGLMNHAFNSQPVIPSLSTMRAHAKQSIEAMAVAACSAKP